mgnify:CR=1 FL=1
MSENVQGKSGPFSWLNENFEKIFMVTGLLAIILFITWQVIYRYIITQFIERAGAAVWTEELSRYIFIWISYLALSVAIKKRSSIRVDIIYDKLPERLQNISWIIVESLFLVLTGVMAMSMLTGCASISSRQVADELEGMLKAANPKATVKAVDDDLANKAVKAAKTDDGKFKADTTLKNDVKTALSKDNTDKYVWYDYFETKDLKKGDKAQKIAKKMMLVMPIATTINTSAAVNYSDVKVDGKTGTAIEAGNEFKLSMKEFTIGSGKDAKDYVMVVVTCKARVKAAA